MAKNLKWILNNEIIGLNQTFTIETQLFGIKKVIELVANGNDILVDEKNKREYVERYFQFILNEEIQNEISAFCQGFYALLPINIFSIFSPSELQILISGSDFVDILKIKSKAGYKGFTGNEDIIKWLWEILEELDAQEKSVFIYFVSGKIIPLIMIFNMPTRMFPSSI